MPRFSRARAEANVRALQDQRLRDLGGAGPAVPDLSLDGIRERHEAIKEDRNVTGRELIAKAGRVFEEAKKLQALANRRPPGSRRTKRLNAKADEALLTAAVQIRIATIAPLDRGYLHAVSIQQIQIAEQEAQRAFVQDAGALAVDTHRRIREQRQRTKAEPEEPR